VFRARLSIRMLGSGSGTAYASKHPDPELAALAHVAAAIGNSARVAALEVVDDFSAVTANKPGTLQVHEVVMFPLRAD
jgi:hypothetical protein